MNRQFVLLGTVAAWAAAATSLEAGSTSTLAREAAEYAVRRFQRGGSKEAVEALSLRIETLALKHGDDVYQAARKVGPQACHWLEQAGEHGPAAARLLARRGEEAVWVVSKPSRLQLLARYGDDAAEVMIRHKAVAEPLVESLGRPAIQALGQIGGKNARRLAIMAEAGELAAIGRTEQLLGVVARFGNRGMEFVWKNKGALAVTAALTAFLANPQPFLEGTVDLAGIVTDNTVGPLVQGAGSAVSKAAGKTDWTIAVVALIAAGSVVLIGKSWLRQRARTGRRRERQEA